MARITHPRSWNRDAIVVRSAQSVEAALRRGSELVRQLVCVGGFDFVRGEGVNLLRLTPQSIQPFGQCLQPCHHVFRRHDMLIDAYAAAEQSMAGRRRSETRGGSVIVSRAVVVALVLGIAFGGGALQSQAPLASAKAEPARFLDPDRRTKLATAFPDIDRVFREFATSSRVPGAAWGIVIDGELAHTGSAGFRELESKSAVDADTVFRIASMTKSFTAMAILSLRDAGKLSLDDPAERFVPELKGLQYPTSDSPRITIRHLLSHSEGFPEDNPWGDQQLGVTASQMEQLLRSGIPFSNAPGIAYEYLELRVRHPGHDRRAGIGPELQRVPVGKNPAPARHDRDHDGTLARASKQAGAWLPVGGRSVEGGTAPSRWDVRADGRHADFDPRLEPVRRRASGRLASARRA